jgi:dipeptidyl aminopeptidase/acylaminoacyl peptidase
LSVPADFLLLDGGLISDPLVVQLFGSTVEQCAELIREGSPVTHVSGDAPPFLIVHGDRDAVVPIRQAQRLYEALSQAGCNVKFVPLAGEGHHFLMLIPALDSVSRMVLAFLDRHLRDASSEAP